MPLPPQLLARHVADERPRLVGLWTLEDCHGVEAEAPTGDIITLSSWGAPATDWAGQEAERGAWSASGWPLAAQAPGPRFPAPPPLSLSASSAPPLLNPAPIPLFSTFSSGQAHFLFPSSPPPAVAGFVGAWDGVSVVVSQPPQAQIAPWYPIQLWHAQA